MNANKKISATIDTFTNYLRESNMRLTSERMAVVEIITKMSNAFSADDLHETVEREVFPLSKATVYNTLNLLVDAGLVKCLRLPDRQTAMYKLTSPDSSQIYYICSQCGKIREVSASGLANKIISHDFGSFTPRKFSLCVYGLCRKCSRKRTKS